MFADSDLWIVPSSDQSAWFARLDWYLNWQMCRGEARPHKPSPAEVFRVAGEHGLEVQTLDPGPDSALMIATNGMVPARACIVLPFGDDLKSWLNAAKSLAARMKAHHARIFLPAGTKLSQATGIWDKLSGTCTAEFTEDIQERP